MARGHKSNGHGPKKLRTKHKYHMTRVSGGFKHSDLSNRERKNIRETGIIHEVKVIKSQALESLPVSVVKFPEKKKMKDGDHR